MRESRQPFPQLAERDPGRGVGGGQPGRRVGEHLVGRAGDRAGGGGRIPVAARQLLPRRGVSAAGPDAVGERPLELGRQRRGQHGASVAAEAASRMGAR